MSKKIVLQNVLVKNSSNRPSKPPGFDFVAGKGFEVIIPSAETTKLSKIKSDVLKKIEEKYPDIPMDSVESPKLYKYNTQTKENSVRFNFTVIKQKDGEYLKDDDGNYVERLVNYIPNEDGKVEAKMPVVIFNGQEQELLPFAGSIVDIEAYIAPQFSSADLKLRFDINIDKIIVTKPVEGSTRLKKDNDFEEISLDDDAEPVVKTKTTKKAEKELEKETTSIDDELDSELDDLV